MFKRDMIEAIKRYAKGFPAIGITGPRQSGKTTIAQMCFPDLPHVSLEDIENRQYALNDPRSFLE